jgi:hypothetical protein
MGRPPEMRSSWSGCPLLLDRRRRYLDRMRDLAGPGGDLSLLKEAMNHPDLYSDLEPFQSAAESILENADEGWD